MSHQGPLQAPLAFKVGSFGLAGERTNGFDNLGIGPKNQRRANRGEIDAGQEPKHIGFRLSNRLDHRDPGYNLGDRRHQRTAASPTAAAEAPPRTSRTNRGNPRVTT